jgi:hypothetical protein
MVAAFLACLPIFCSAVSAAELDRYGGWTGIKGKKTGFFHLEKIEGREWFVTPEGNVFFGVSLSHFYAGDSKVVSENVYGGDKRAFMEDTLKLCKEMGFNCALGSATSPERNLNGYVDFEMAESLFRKNDFPYTVGVILLKHPWEFVDGETLPDIFEPSYKDLIESRAKEVCTKYENDPLVMGYYYGFGAFNSAAIWVNHHLSLPPGSAGREAITDLLISKYGDSVSKFNEVYGLGLKKLSELKNEKVLEYNKAFELRNYDYLRKNLDAAQLEDFEAIVSHMCVTLYQSAHSAIRAHDRNHLIFGSYIKEWALSPKSWKAAAPYVDMIAPQHVNRDISIGEAGKAANLPILISDDYFGNHYSSPTRPGHGGVKSHEARGLIYQANLMRHYKDPQVLGVAYCAGMHDQSGKYTRNWRVDNGFIDVHGKRREPLIDKVKEINFSLYEHASAPADSQELKQLDKVLFDTWEKYQFGHTGLWGHKPKAKAK